MKKIFILLLISLVFVEKGIAQYEIPDVPDKQTSFYDYVDLLNQSGARFLEEKLIQYSDSTSTQIVIIIIDSTQGEQILDLATRWGNEWGIGQKEKDNGIVLLVAKDDREVAISVGSGLRSQLTDSNAKRVIDERIIPQFKKEKYYRGLYDGVEGVISFLEGTFDQVSIEEKSDGIISDKGNTFGNKILRNLQPIIFFGLAIIALWLAPKKPIRRRDDHWDDDRWEDDDWDHDSWGSDYDSGDSGGFDDGFDGGDFDGDGASGKW